MANKPKFKPEQVILAIQKTNGMLTRTADYLNCSYNLVRRYIDKHPEVKEAYQDARYRMADNIETTLLTEALGRLKVDPQTGKTLTEYDREPNVTALIFLAKTHPAMRERGYAERTEVTGANGSAIQTQQTNVNIAAESAHDASNILKQLAELGAIPSSTGDSGHNAETE